MTFQNAFEWQIALYLFLAGMGAGAILSSVILEFYNPTLYKSYIKSAGIVGMPLVSIGCLFLLIDLGQGLWKPWLLIRLFFNPTSAITWGTAILTVFIIYSTIYALYHWGVIKSGGGTLTKIILIIFSIGTAGYTAVLLGVLKAIPFWHQTSLPILFIISATSTGISITIIVQKIFLQDEVDLKKVESGHFYLLVLEIFLLMGFILIAFSGVPEMVYSVKSLLFGIYSLYFWLFLLLLGLIIPTIVFGLLEFKNFHFGNKTIILVEFLVVMGGFFLRYLIIHAGVFTEKFISYIGG
jgi:formate-dependent nitrite reductase membrane component NrfD